MDPDLEDKWFIVYWGTARKAMYRLLYSQCNEITLAERQYPSKSGTFPNCIPSVEYVNS